MVRTATRSQRTGRGRQSDGQPAHLPPPRQSVQRRILSRALTISIVPLLVIGSVTLGSLLGLSRSAERSLDRSGQELGRDVADRGAQADAVAVAREVDQLLAERVDDVIGWSTAPEMRRAARVAAEVDGGDTLALQPDNDLEQQFTQDRRLRAGTSVDRYLRDAVARQPQFSELSFSERNGLNVAASGRPEDFVQRDEQWWNTAWNDGLFLGDVRVDESTNTHGLTIAARIDGGSATGPLGVFRATVDLDVLQRVATRVADDTGSEVTILTGDGILLAETTSDHDPSRIGDPTPEFEGPQADVATAALEGDAPGSIVQGDAVTGFSPVAAVEGRLPEVLQEFDDIDARPLDWVAVVAQPSETTPLRGLSDLRVQLSTTARTFSVIILVTLAAALLAAFVVSTRLARRIVQPLRSLGAFARDIADQRLPALVRRAHAPDASDDLPDIPTVRLDTNDEIEDVADAFNVVCSTAAELAAEQARSRRSVARMFVSLGRRNQNLLSRQLEFIDRLERETSDPDVLEDLFRLDHLATRMRRNAESLLVLAGGEPPRRWAEPVSLTDVVRGAVAEVEDYQRVDVDDVDEAQLIGSAVSDVTHLLAELIENAAQFSPPDTKVVVVGRRVVDGYSLAVVDDGVGMSEEQLADVNQRLETSPLVDRVPSSFLGLFVVGRLAARHGIQVRLVESTTEGVTAKVLLPTSLVEPQPRALSSGRPDDVRRRPALEAGTFTRRAVRAPVATIPAQTTATAVVVDAGEPAPLPPTGDGADAADQDIDLRDPPNDESGDEGAGPADDEPSDATATDDRALTTEPIAVADDDSAAVADDGSVAAVLVAAADEEPVAAASVGDGDVTDGPDAGTEADGPDAGTEADGPDAGTEADGPDAGTEADGPDAVTDRSGDQAADEPSDGTAGGNGEATEPAVLEVPRRSSKRTDGNGAAATATTAGGRAVLRTERAADDAPSRTRQAARRAASTIVTEEDGVVLTPAEREARAARERLARFQRAVQRGRAESGAGDQTGDGERDDA